MLAESLQFLQLGNEIKVEGEDQMIEKSSRPEAIVILIWRHIEIDNGLADWLSSILAMRND